MWHRNQNRDRNTERAWAWVAAKQTLHPATHTHTHRLTDRQREGYKNREREREGDSEGRLNLCLVLLMSRITHRQSGAGAARGAHTRTLRLLSGRRKVWQLLYTHTHTLSLPLSFDGAWLWQVGKDLCDWQRNSQKMQTIPCGLCQRSWPGAV